MISDMVRNVLGIQVNFVIKAAWIEMLYRNVTCKNFSHFVNTFRQMVGTSDSFTYVKCL